MTNVTRLARLDTALGAKANLRWVQSALGRIAVNPWIDAPALWGIGSIYMPLSRLWAAASVAKGDPEAFLTEIPLERAGRAVRAGLSATLRRHDHRRERMAAAVADWEAGFFGGGPGDLPALEERRIAQAQRYMLERLRFVHLRLLTGRAVPPVRFAVPSPEAVLRDCRPYLDDPASAFRPPDGAAEIERSSSIPSEFGTDYWLRFPSPSARIGGRVWARVHEPADGVDLPTLIFANGVCVDVDQWRATPRELLELCRSGLRVIEFEAPWHGRRSAPGRYGGEPFFGTTPQGPIDLFTAAVQELGLLIGWCRAHSDAPVGVGGVSMGAITSMLLGSHCAGWPDALRPDALMLVAVADNIAELAFKSAIVEAAGVPDAIRAQGWTPELLATLAPLTAVGAEPGLDPSSIVAVLGTRDTVTPFDDGSSLVAKWRLPAKNVFLRDLGHLTVAANLSRDAAPVLRFAEILRAKRRRR